MSRYPLTMLLMLLMPLASAALERNDPMRPDDPIMAITRGTQTGATKVAKPSRLEPWLQSIQIGMEEKSATINGKLLKIGDMINGARVTAIEHNRVKLNRGGKEIELLFLPQTIKR